MNIHRSLGPLRREVPLHPCGSTGHTCPHRLVGASTKSKRCRSTFVAASAAVDIAAAGPLPPTLPTTYKRLVARQCGESFRKVAAVREVEMRPPGPGEVLIRVTHAGINGGCETFRARGDHAFASNQGLQDFPLGAEGAGVVEALGPGAAKGGLAVGQMVAMNGAAAFAEYVVAKAALVTPVPEGVGGPEAAALVLSGVTACVALEATARVRPGEVVAVTAAAGGTGHLAVQLAAAAGARVVAVVGGPRKAEAVAALGAHDVVDYSEEGDLAAALRRLCPAGIDVVYEGVGGLIRTQMIECLAPAGRLLQVGYISEYPHTHQQPGQQPGQSTGGQAAAASARPDDALAVPPSADLFWKGLNVELGQQRLIGQVWPQDLKAILKCRRRVFDLASKGKLRILTDQGHGHKGVAGIPAAVDYMLRGGHIGKVVLEI